MLGGLKSMLKMKDIWLLLCLFLVGMGVFNGVSTWMEGIVRPKGFSITQAGDLGGILLLGGVLGAIALPALSDRLHKRKIFLLAGMALAIPGLIGITLATSYGWMLVSMFVLGFFLISLAPIGYQYAAEITYPAPEGTSNGLLNLAGQASVVFHLLHECAELARHVHPLVKHFYRDDGAGRAARPAVERVAHGARGGGSG